jgi:hypothetical protein
VAKAVNLNQFLQKSQEVSQPTMTAA